MSYYKTLASKKKSAWSKQRVRSLGTILLGRPTYPISPEDLKGCDTDEQWLLPHRLPMDCDTFIIYYEIRWSFM